MYANTTSCCGFSPWKLSCWETVTYFIPGIGACIGGCKVVQTDKEVAELASGVIGKIPPIVSPDQTITLTVQIEKIPLLEQNSFQEKKIQRNNRTVATILNLSVTMLGVLSLYIRYHD